MIYTVVLFVMRRLISKQTYEQRDGIYLTLSPRNHSGNPKMDYMG